MIQDIEQKKLLNAYAQLSDLWDNDIIPTLEKFIRIPNKSPLFDPDWEKHGFMDDAILLISNWCKQQPIKNMHLEVIKSNRRTPLLFIDIPGENSHAPILLYGHLDKQPEMHGWKSGFGPWKPVLQNGKLYGRGAADDGYSVFAALSAITQLQTLNIPHTRCIVLIEASEESGSVDLPYYLQQLYSRIGNPNLIIGLDSGCGNYEQLWGTTSLRGVLNATLTIKVLHHGLHSGYAGGIVPNPSSILRILLDRIEEAHTSKICLDKFHTPIPEEQYKFAEKVAATFKEKFIDAFPFAGQTQPIVDDITQLILNRTWNPALAITGIEGIPPIAQSGNVIIPNLTVKLSLRLPPDCNPQLAMQELKHTLEKDPPYNAEIHFTAGEAAAGWLANPLADWLRDANELASQLFFNKPAMYSGEGGTIPFMGMLAKEFPHAQFLITGVLGPGSNAHGPNEFLHIDMAKKLTACVAAIIASQYQQPSPKIPPTPLFQRGVGGISGEGLRRT